MMVQKNYTKKEPLKRTNAEPSEQNHQSRITKAEYSLSQAALS